MKQQIIAFLLALVFFFIFWDEKALHETFSSVSNAIGSNPSLFSVNATSLPCSFLIPTPEDLDYCEEHNFLPDTHATVLERNDNNSRTFSIRATDFQPRHSRTCSSVQDTVDAIRYGSRRWDHKYQNLSLLERESIPSTFVPHGCDVPLYTPKQMCDVLNRFSHVVIQGDSLSRHVQGGLLMGLRNDLIRGALVQTVPSSYYRCRCDAQFSEHQTCREHAPLYCRFRPYQLGLCPELDVEDQFESVFNINRLHKGVYNFDGVDCTSGKGILVIAQGGVHLKHNAGETYRKILQRFLDDPVFRSCADQNKAFLIWTSYQAQSESYHKKYPHQSLRVGIPFNQQMKEYIQGDEIQNLTTMDWLNFTTGAQHSDGLHFAAQVNYFKAQHIVAVADLMWKERMTITYNQTPPFDCGCPNSCDAEALSKRNKKLPFSCRERIEYLMQRHGASQSKACSAAVEMNACGSECSPDHSHCKRAR